MTDTMNEAPDTLPEEGGTEEIIDLYDDEAEWAPILEAYNKRIAQIEELDALTEPEAGGRKKLRELLEDPANEEAVTEARKIIDTINRADEMEKLIFSAIMLAEGKNVFQEPRDKFIKKNSTKVEPLPEAEVEKINAKRNKLSDAVGGLRVTLKAMIDNDTAFDTLAKPPRKKSTAPATGKRIKGEWYFTISEDGKPDEKWNVKDGNHISAKPSELAKYLDVKTGTISGLLEAKALKPGELPEAWEVKIGNKTILAEQNPEKKDIEDDPEEDPDNQPEDPDEYK